MKDITPFNGYVVIFLLQYISAAGHFSTFSGISFYLMQNNLNFNYIKNKNVREKLTDYSMPLCITFLVLMFCFLCLNCTKLLLMGMDLSVIFILCSLKIIYSPF